MGFDFGMRTFHHRTVHRGRFIIGRFINAFLVEHHICFAKIHPSSFQAGL